MSPSPDSQALRNIGITVGSLMVLALVLVAVSLAIAGAVQP